MASAASGTFGSSQSQSSHSYTQTRGVERGSVAGIRDSHHKNAGNVAMHALGNSASAFSSGAHPSVGHAYALAAPLSASSSWKAPAADPDPVLLKTPLEKLHADQLKSLYESNITEELRGAILDHCRGRKHLSFEEPHYVTDAILNWYVERCPQLDSLDLSGCSSLSEKCIRTLLQSQSRWVSINLADCEWTDDTVEAISQVCSNLRELNLQRAEIKPKEEERMIDGKITRVKVYIERNCCKGRDVSSYLKIAKNSPQLEQLNLKSNAIDNRVVTAFAENCPLLKKIAIGGRENREVGEKSLQALARHCPLLEDVNFYYLDIEDSGIAALAAGCPNLINVNLYLCQRLRDASLAALAWHCPKIQLLDVYFLIHLTEQGVAAFLEHCPNLRDINLGGCYAITDTLVEKLTRHCPLLERMDLSGGSVKFKGITDQGLKTIAAAYPRLKKIRLFGNDGITDTGVIDLANHCPQLEEINLARQYKGPHFKKETIIRLAQRCPQLRIINLSFCTKLDEEVFLEISKNCKQLEALGLNAESISEETMRKILHSGTVRRVKMDHPFDFFMEIVLWNYGMKGNAEYI